MTAWIADALSWACLVAGVGFALISAVGLIRLPDVYSRMHSAGILDTMAAGLVILGLILQAGWDLVSGKLLLILAFLFFTGPIATHALARALINAGVRPMTVAERDKGDPPSNT